MSDSDAGDELDFMDYLVSHNGAAHPADAEPQALEGECESDAIQHKPLKRLKSLEEIDATHIRATTRDATGRISANATRKARDDYARNVLGHEARWCFVCQTVTTPVVNPSS